MRFDGLLSFLFTGQPFSKRELDAVRNEVSFSDAIQAHLDWKLRLVACIDGNAQEVPHPSEVSHDKNCALGQWIHGAGMRRYGHLDAFRQIQAQHERFHILAGEIVVAHRSNDTHRARQLLSGEFDATSRDIVARIKHMAELFHS